jgi:O-acetyl-ADP-ribose deacetylase (regulator of RNase III)
MLSELTACNGLIFRITHRNNIPWILDNGLHCRNSKAKDPNFVQIGNPDLISKRHSKVANGPYGGTLSDYVPFYFTPLSPMFYNIKTCPDQTGLVLLMISFTQGNLLAANAEALVNTVNTVGVMGKGIALMFKETFPENFKIYQAACKRGEVQIGHMLVTERQDMYGQKWIINFPTKKHWRSPSHIEWIEEGLKDLARVIRENKIESVAIPPLGSGQGGLDWQDVRPKIEAALGKLPDVEIIVYEPTPCTRM